MNTTDIPDIPEESDVVPGGGPAEGEESHEVPNPNPDAVHPDYQQTIPGAPAPAPTVEPAEEPSTGEDTQEEK